MKGAVRPATDLPSARTSSHAAEYGSAPAQLPDDEHTQRLSRLILKQIVSVSCDPARAVTLRVEFLNSVGRVAGGGIPGAPQPGFVVLPKSLPTPKPKQSTSRVLSSAHVIAVDTAMSTTVTAAFDDTAIGPKY